MSVSKRSLWWLKRHTYIGDEYSREDLDRIILRDRHSVHKNSISTVVNCAVRQGWLHRMSPKVYRRVNGEKILESLEVEDRYVEA